jgi:O-antigen ligase
MIRDRPVLGFGPDQFLYAYVPRYIQPTAWDERFTSHAHNLLADSWIRLGIIGAIAAIVVVVFVARQIVNDRTDNIGRSALSKAATVALGATLVHGLIDNAYFGHDLAMSAWLLAWLAFEHSGQKDRRALQDA